MGTIKEISDPTIVIGALTDAGRSGKNNEDNFVVFESQSGGKEGTTSRAMAETVQVLMVADGIGGNVAGETASQMAVDTFHTAFAGAKSQSVSQRLVEALDSANHAIYQKSIDQPNLQGMGTTVVAAALAGNRLYVAHAGDSRAYLIRKGKAQQLTLDHTWAQEAIEAGRLTAAQAREHPNRHVIKRFVGIAPTVDVDPMLLDINRGPLDPDQIQSWPKSDYLDLQPDDIVLLCSDGLTDVVSDKEIEQTVSRHQPQEAARKLIDLANKAGGPDNITVLILQRRQPGAPVAKPGGRSPVMAAVLGAVLIVMAAVTWVILNNFGNGAVVEATATPTLVANANPTATPEALAENPTTAPTATIPPATATETPSATPSPSPSATATPLATYAVEGTPTNVADFVNQEGEGLATTISSLADGTTVATTVTATVTPNGTSTRPPTSTPVEDTPTPIATLTPTVTPTNQVRTPTRIATANPAAPSLSTPTNANSTSNAPSISVSLIKPEDGFTFDNKVTLEWAISSSLPEGYLLEPVFWRNGEDPMSDGRGYGGTTKGSSVSVNAEIFRKSGEGQYYWGVLLIQEPYNKIAFLNEKRLINVKLSAPESDSSSNDPPPPAGGGDREDE